MKSKRPNTSSTLYPKKSRIQKIKDNIIISLIVLGFACLVFGIGYIKYNIWRAEHPQAKTWTFFIPNRR